MRQMSYSLCRFWAYDESKKIVGAGAFSAYLFVQTILQKRILAVALSDARFATFLF
jgi:hypothetical protein